MAFLEPLEVITQVYFQGLIPRPGSICSLPELSSLPKLPLERMRSVKSTSFHCTRLGVSEGFSTEAELSFFVHAVGTGHLVEYDVQCLHTARIKFAISESTTAMLLKQNFRASS